MSYQYGIYHEGGASEIAWKIHTKWLPKSSLHVTSRTGMALRDGVAPSKEPDDGVQCWDRSSPTYWREEVQPTAWASTQRGSRQILVRDGFLQGACEVPVAFALALRVALTEFDDEMRKQGYTTELEYWAYVDEITTATTAELAPFCQDQNSKKRQRNMARSSEATNARPTAQLKKKPNRDHGSNTEKPRTHERQIAKSADPG